MSDSGASDTLKRSFHEAMLGIYQRAKKETGYNATRFLHMVGEGGGLETAQSLLATDNVSDGFTELYLRGRRLDLTMEYLVLQQPWRSLFAPDELETARVRLRAYEFDPPADDAE